VDGRAENGKTALWLAVSNGQLATARALLEGGADVEAPEARQVTALMCACSIGRLDLVTLLLEHEADVDARDERSRTPVDHAREGRSIETVEALLAAGADVLRQSIPLVPGPLRTLLGAAAAVQRQTYQPVPTHAVTFEDVTLDATTDYVALVREQLESETRFLHKKDYFEPWRPIDRALEALAGTAQFELICRAAGQCLGHADPEVRRHALQLVWHPPARTVAAAREILAQLRPEARPLFEGVPKDAHSLDIEQDLDALLRLSLGKLIEAADPEAIAIARREALRPGKPRPFIDDLARYDPEWVEQHAVAIVEGSPEAAVPLLSGLWWGARREYVDLAVTLAPLADRDPKFRELLGYSFSDADAKERIFSVLPNPPLRDHTMTAALRDLKAGKLYMKNATQAGHVDVTFCEAGQCCRLEWLSATGKRVAFEHWDADELRERLRTHHIAGKAGQINGAELGLLKELPSEIIGEARELVRRAAVLQAALASDESVWLEVPGQYGRRSYVRSAADRGWQFVGCRIEDGAVIENTHGHGGVEKVLFRALHAKPDAAVEPVPANVHAVLTSRGEAS
jgi:hypothetical protein